MSYVSSESRLIYRMEVREVTLKLDVVIIVKKLSAVKRKIV